jgi:hypothetical protein
MLAARFQYARCSPPDPAQRDFSMAGDPQLTLVVGQRLGQADQMEVRQRLLVADR